MWGNLGLILMGGASKSLIQFLIDGRGSVPSLLFVLTMVGVMVAMTASSKRTYDRLLHSDPTAGHCRLTPLPETPGHSQASLAQSLVGKLLLSPGSWYTQGFVCALQVSISPVLWKFCNQIPLASKIKFPEGSQSLCRIPRLGICRGS